MTVTLEELRAYCRIDQSDENDALLTSLAEAAESYLKNNAGSDPDSMTEDALRVYKLAVKRMTLAAYDDPAGRENPPGMRRLIHAVKVFNV